MSSYCDGDMIHGDFLGGWQSDIADLIALDTGTKKLSDGKVNDLNKKYEEALYYGLQKNSIDDYIIKALKVTKPVAESFRMRIEKIKGDELKARERKIANKDKPKLSWKYYAIAGGVMLTVIALSPTLMNLSKLVSMKKSS